ncbi:PKD domain-containing protein, partial [candidate division KSB1 bacterium]|nr:PKD domain-containing protein [candidate division KSB1 bacterium]
MRISTLQCTWVWLRTLLICFIVLPFFINSAEAQCVADFTCGDRSGCAPFTTTFTDQSSSSEGVRSWSWTFTNLETGTVLTSTAQNPQMTFNEAGPYDVSLTVECYDGQDTKTEDSYITVQNCQCTADFYASDTVGCAPFTTTFYDNSDGAVYWSWSFPGGSPSSATGQGPHTVTYNVPGRQDVTLDIECTGGSDIITKEDYILARNCTTPCEAAFEASPRQGCAPLTVNFTDQSTNAQSWYWKFPGGTPTSSTQQNPTVTYSTPGTYHVALKIICTNGQVDSLIMPNYITAEYCGEPCEAAFEASPRQGCAPLTVNFTDISTNAQSWYWKFPGGNPATSNQQNPTVVYSNPGTYSVALKIICTDGQVDSLIQVDYIVAEDCGEDNASVGDRVWRDLNQNGLQDPGEPGLDSVQVSLFDQNGNLLAMTITTSSGFYLFSFPPGSYFINFSLRPGFVYSPPDQGADDSIDSDAQLGTGDTPVFTLGAGENNTTMDAGMYQPEGDGEVLGHKWHDLNNNGLRDAGEPGLANWEIILDYNQDGVLDPSVDWITTTDSNGDYKFTGYFNGDYFIGEILQPGWQQTYPDTAYATHLGNVAPYDHWFYLSPNQAISGLDFGNIQRDEEYDFGDAPDPSYPTLFASNGARHVINPNLFLGSGIDPEPNGQPSGMADGDDKNIAFPGIPYPAGDEDGVIMSPFIAPGQSVPITVVASDTGVLNAWIDFNRNGNWADAGEHFIPAMPVYPGSNLFTMNVPVGAQHGTTYARFRFSSIRQLSYDGIAPDGEVEDYAIEIVEGDDGSITIIKDANPKDNTPFSICTQFSGGFFNVFCVNLLDPFMNKWTILNPSQVDAVTEAIVSGWALVDITVTGDSDNGSAIDLAAGRVDVDYDPGENIVIVFKNEKTGDDELFDLGDAPDGSNHSGLSMDAYPGVSARFPTVFDPATGLPQGPRHMQPKADAWLGPNVSGELDADIMPDNDGLTNIDPPNNAADRDGFDDGLLFPVSLPSCKLWNIFFKVTIPPGSAGVDRYVNVWFDWNRDGDWDDTFSCHSQNDAPEWAVENQMIWGGMPPGAYTYVSFQFLPYHPSGREKSPIWMRINISEQRATADAGGRGPANGFLYGETEDYYFVPGDTTEQGELDFGDAPDPSYPTLLGSNGARHVINPNLFLGSGIDPEPDGQPNGTAEGDDKNITYPGIPFPAGDEDGVQLPSIITHGSTVQVNVFASAPGVVNAWLDFNRNGSWADAGEHIIPAMPVVAGINTFSFTVPPGAVVGQSYARFRLSSVRNISFDGLAPDGEVEDYAVAIQEEGDGGNLTIIKDADPKDDTPFWISVVYGIHGGAAPYRDPSMNSSTIINSPAGTYFIGESVPAGWTLTDIDIIGDADNGSSIDLN